MSDAPQQGQPPRFEGLFADIPPELRLQRPLQLAPPLAESELNAHLLDLAAPDTHLDEAVCFLGGGTYDHYVPAIVDAIAASAGHALITPDAPQPLLQTLYELQTLFAPLAGLDLAAAALPDGPAALAEAVRTAAKATGRSQAVLARTVNPRYRAIARTLLAPPLALDEVGYHGGVTRPGDLERLVSDQTACVVVEQPNYFGCFEDIAALAAVAHRQGALCVVKVDPIALGLLQPPGALGADIAVADAQCLGSRPRFGSDSLGLLACRGGLAHALAAWRVERQADRFSSVGATARPVRAEQVIRPVVYLAALGGEGLARVASLSMAAAHAAQRGITAIEGFTLRFRVPFFKEFAVECDKAPDEVTETLLESNILGALPLQPDYPEMEQCALFAATERRTRADIDMLRHSLELLAELGENADFSLENDDA